jgi:DNA-binding NtrC family response regulator
MKIGGSMPKILVIDDDEVVRALYTEELTEDGYEVISTGDCSNLTKMISELAPDLILLDIRMGEYDGLELLQDIRRVFYNLPVVLCSAYSTFKFDLKSIAADYYVVKSADLQELKVAICKALEGTSSPTQENGGKDRKNENESWESSSVFVG